MFEFALYLFMLAFFMLMFGMMVDVNSSPSGGGGVWFVIVAGVIIVYAICSV